jgi:hypothetical protein
MPRALTILAVVAGAALFGFGAPLPRLLGAFQPLTVALSIMIAAIFVRLNRGMPSLDWKNLDFKQRTRLTFNIVELTQEYARIIAINAVFLTFLVTLTVVGKEEIEAAWPDWARHVSAGAIGAGVALCVCRMAYVVWRDIDIVKLQKHLIDGSTSREAAEAEARASDNKIADIRSAGLKRIAVRDPKTWGE